MKKAISALLVSGILAVSAMGGACKDTTSDLSSDSGSETPVSTVWTPENILLKPVSGDDLLIGSWVTFADTATKLSAVDQIERYYYAGINFMPYASTIPSAGMIGEEEKEYLSRDLTSALWWQKVDSIMEEYNMVYYFSTLAGIGNDHENCGRRNSMMDDMALDDARQIIPQLNNCIGVHVLDEPFPDAFERAAMWARRYAAITDADNNPLGLEALVNMMSGMPYEQWMSYAGSSVGIFSHDLYPFHTDWTHYAFFGEMNEMRRLANEYGVKQGMFPQSCGWNGTRMPNFEEIKWQFLHNLAMGVTEFYYFNFSTYPAEGNFDAIFAADGTVLHPELLESLTEFHKEVRALDANVQLNDLNATEVYFTIPDSSWGGALPIGGIPDNWLLSGEGFGKNFLISLLEPDEKKTDSTVKYLNIVNGSFEEAVAEQQFLLGENSDIAGLEVYNWKTGKFEPVEIINGAFELSFEKSDSKFLRIQSK